MDALQRLEKKIAARKAKKEKPVVEIVNVLPPPPAVRIIRTKEIVPAENIIMKKVKILKGNYAGASNLAVGSIVNDIRKCKVESIKHFSDGSAEVDLEILHESWSRLL